MASKNTPIGGMVGKNQTMNAINAMSEPASGVTAGDVIKQPRPIGSNFEFQARGGIQNTINQKINTFKKQMLYKEQQKQFEEYLATKQKGAMAAYQEALGIDPELKNWIPHPDLFYDEGTGAFMPLKYAEAFATGYKEYQKNKTAAAGQELQGKKLDQSIGYQNQRLQQGEQGLALQAEGVKTSQANTLISASNAAETARKNQVKEDTDAAKFAEDSARKDRSALLASVGKVVQAANGFDEEAKKTAINEYKQNKLAAKDSQFKLMKHNAVQAGKEVSDEAINTAIDIQEATDLQDQYESALGGKPYDPENPPTVGDPTTFNRTMGNEFDKKYGFVMVPGLAEKGSAMANRITFYGSTIGAKAPNGSSIPVEKVDEWLKSYKPEEVIQFLIALSKQKNQ